MTTSSFKDNDTYSIYIPGILEHFYIQKLEPGELGTEVVLELKNDYITKFNLNEAISKYLIKTPVNIEIQKDESNYIVLADKDLNLSSVVTIDSSKFELLEFRPKFNFCRGVFGIPVPIFKKLGEQSNSRLKEYYNDLPSSVIKISRQGIFVQKYDKLFKGAEKPKLDQYDIKIEFNYFNKIFGLIDIIPPFGHISVPRGKVILSDEDLKKLHESSLNGLLDEIIKMSFAISKEKHISDSYMQFLIRYFIFDIVTEGKNYWHHEKSLEAYEYCNDQRIKEKMCILYHKLTIIDYIFNSKSGTGTLEQIIASLNPTHIYICLKTLVDTDLFKSFINQKDNDAAILMVGDKREGSLLFFTIKKYYDTHIEELTSKYLHSKIKFDIINTELDNYLPAASATVKIYDYGRNVAIIRLPIIKSGTINKIEGMTRKRSEIHGSQRPYILLNENHWFIKNLIIISEMKNILLISSLEKIIHNMVICIFNSDSVKLRLEGMKLINKDLKSIYKNIESNAINIEQLQQIFLKEEDI